MFLRWQSRKARAPWPSKGLETRWTAVLVRAIRIDGKPRQRATSLATFERNSQCRHLIWDRITKKLDQLQPANREKIEKAIAKKLPRPTLEHYKEAARDRVAIVGWDYITDQERLCLQDEAAQWQAGVRNETPDAPEDIASRPCDFCQATGRSLAGENGHCICLECAQAVVAILQNAADSLVV
jgi:hypothetical protein